MTLKKAINKLHLWLGMLSGLVVFILGITGCIYVFSYEIQDVLYADRLKADTVLPAQRSVEEILKAANREIPDSISYSMMYLPANPSENAIVYYQKMDTHAWTYNSYMPFNKTVFVNPSTGQVEYVENTKWEFFNVVFWLHMCLLLGYEPGSMIVTVAVYIFIFMLFSGLILWWPGKKKRKQHFRFLWKKTTRWRRKNYDLHRILGFYVIPLALLAALTGLFWASPDYATAARWLANGGKNVPREFFPASDTTNSPAINVLDQAVAQTYDLVPEAKYILIKAPRNKRAPLIVRANPYEVNYLRHELAFDQYSGELLGQSTFGEKNRGDQLAAINYDLHVGRIAGLPTQILAFLGSLVAASLPVTGFMIWLGRRRKEKRIR